MTDTAADPRIGTIVAERYEIVERIGEGGVGVVYRAIQRPIGRTVALKVLLPDALDERTIARFFKEAKIIANLRHPHTVKLHDYGRTEQGDPFLVMEYIEGGTLRDMMNEGRVRQVPALRIVSQVCRALEEAHAAGVVHRDLKPENVLFDRVRGEALVVRVVDFGMAQTAEPPLEPESSGEWRGGVARDLTPPKTRLGTPGYMAPEQAFAKEIDGRADVYVVGVLLFEMITGHPHPSWPTRATRCTSPTSTTTRPTPRPSRPVSTSIPRWNGFCADCSRSGRRTDPGRPRRWSASSTGSSRAWIHPRTRPSRCASRTSSTPWRTGARHPQRLRAPRRSRSSAGCAVSVCACT